MIDPKQPLFEFRRHRGRYRGRPVHLQGWLALTAALVVPHLGWLVWLIEPELPGWLPFVSAMLLLGPALFWLIWLARRHGRFID